MDTATILILFVAGVGQCGLLTGEDLPDAVKPARDGPRRDAAAAVPLEELKQSGLTVSDRYDVRATEGAGLKAGADPELDQPAPATFAGAVVWVSDGDGRPEVVASIDRYMAEGKPVEDNEFQSLSCSPGLDASRTPNGLGPRAAGLQL